MERGLDCQSVHIKISTSAACKLVLWTESHMASLRYSIESYSTFVWIIQFEFRSERSALRSHPHFCLSLCQILRDVHAQSSSPLTIKLIINLHPLNFLWHSITHLSQWCHRHALFDRTVIIDRRYGPWRDLFWRSGAK